VPAYLIVPTGKGPFAAIEFVHWGQGDRTEFLNEALTYAKGGTISLLIDAPFNRPDYQSGPSFMDNPERERRMYIQLVVDMRRGIDLLLSRSDVDPKRVAFVGHSLGATWGGALAGIDKRIKAFVLMGGLPNLTDFSGDDAFSKAVRQKYSPEQIQKYVQTLGPINPENFVTRAAPARLYFQFARWDRYISQSAAQRYERVASQPKLSRTYDTSHEFNDPQSSCDRTGWIRQELALGVAASRTGCGEVGGMHEQMPVSDSSETRQQRQTEVSDVEQQFADTMKQRDFSRFQQFLAPEAIFIGQGQQPTPARGKNAVAARWRTFLRRVDAAIHQGDT